MVPALSIMCPPLIFRNQKYFKPFDGSDYAGCWQIRAVRADLEKILDPMLASYRMVTEKWGVGYSWKTPDRVLHCLTLECTDVNHAEYTIHCGASKRDRLIFRKSVPFEETEFPRILPALAALGEPLGQKVG